MKIDIKKYKETKEQTVTTSDVIKKSFKNVYDKLKDNDVVLASNQRNVDLVIMTIDNYEKISNKTYSKEESFDGVVKTSEHNVFLTRKFIKENTYLLMQFESMNVTFPTIEYIANNQNGTYEYEEMVTKNLMDSWKFILGNYDTISFDKFKVLNNMISQGQNLDPGQLRSGATSVSGTTFKPAVPTNAIVKKMIDDMSKEKDVYKAISEFVPKAIKSQFFWDGNKRTAFLFANLLLINKGKGVVVVNKEDFAKFNKLLNDYYNNEDKLSSISKFILDKCFYNTTDKRLIR